MINNFAYTGHFGDVYIVICKLYYYKIQNNLKKIKFTRFTYDVESPFDKEILSLINSFDWIDFVDYPKKMHSKRELLYTLKKNKFIYITPFINGFDASYSELCDGIPIKSAISPFNKEKLTGNHKKTVLIHLQTGKYGGNYKELCLKSVKIFLKKIKFDGRVILTGIGKNISQDLSILESEFVCENFIDKFSTIFELMNLILKVDYLISPDGFPAFFAMSNKIPTLVLYTFPYALRRVPIEWLSRSYVINAISTGLYETLDLKIRNQFNIPAKLLKIPENNHLIEFIESFYKK